WLSPLPLPRPPRPTTPAQRSRAACSASWPVRLSAAAWARSITTVTAISAGGAPMAAAGVFVTILAGAATSVRASAPMAMPTARASTRMKPAVAACAAAACSLISLHDLQPRFGEAVFVLGSGTSLLPCLLHGVLKHDAVVGGGWGARIGGVAVVGERALDHPVELALGHSENRQTGRNAEFAVESGQFIR